MPVHTLFDILASLSSALVTFICYRWRLRDAAQKLDQAGLLYAVALIAGAAFGGYGLGTLNMVLSGKPEVARSILGALAGAIAAIELFKYVRGMKGSTGLIFVPAFAVTVIVGRWGCFMAGFADETYGNPSPYPWSVDFGDGIPRHPVQLYESFAMLAFLTFAIVRLAQRDQWFVRNGFYALVLFYAGQRFLWEFLKPYAAIIGPFNLFHVVRVALIAYASIMMGKRDERASP